MDARLSKRSQGNSTGSTVRRPQHVSMPRTATTCAVILVAVAGCRTSSEPSGQPPVIVTTTPPHGNAPAYASCGDFAKVFDSRDENQLSYLPDKHWLIVSPTSTAYKIDLINDTHCIEANPDLATFVAQFMSQQENGQRSEDPEHFTSRRPETSLRARRPSIPNRRPDAVAVPATRDHRPQR